MALTKARLLKHDFPVHGFPSRFFFVFFFVISTGIRCGVDIAQKTKQEWPDSGSTLEFFCKFYEINSSQDFFGVLQKFWC